MDVTSFCICLWNCAYLFTIEKIWHQKFIVTYIGDCQYNNNHCLPYYLTLTLPYPPLTYLTHIYQVLNNLIYFHYKCAYIGIVFLVLEIVISKDKSQRWAVIFKGTKKWFLPHSRWSRLKHSLSTTRQSPCLFNQDRGSSEEFKIKFSLKAIWEYTTFTEQILYLTFWWVLGFSLVIIFTYMETIREQLKIEKKIMDTFIESDYVYALQ